MKRAKVTVIYKSGDKNAFSNYRPISVLPVLSKPLEKLVLLRLDSFCNKHSLISPFQFGFRKGMSTELALLTQKEIILKSFLDKKLIMGIFIDFTKAFDSLNHQTLIAKLEFYGFRGIALEFLKSYLSNRKQCVAINNNFSSLMNLNAGVPQGSILGPQLFNLYINDIGNIAEKSQLIVYADDTSIFVQSDNPSDLCNNVNSTLQNLYEWSNRNSLQINSAKTKAVLFTPYQKPIIYNFNIHIGNNPIEVASEAKTLGVTFHQHLSWNSHVQHILTHLAKISGVLWRLRYILPLKFKLLIYNALFYAQLNYCGLVWGTTSKENINKIFLCRRKPFVT